MGGSDVPQACCMYGRATRALRHGCRDMRRCTEHLEPHRSVSKLRVDVTRPAVSYQACALQAMNARASIAGYDTCAAAFVESHCSRDPTPVASFPMQTKACTHLPRRS